MPSPTARSLALLRSEGWTACIVEKWIPKRKIRLDAFGFGDLLACHADPQRTETQASVFGTILLIQTTTGANAAARVTKILAEPRAKVWLQAGGRIIVHGWSKTGPRGKRKTWTCRAQEIRLQDFGSEAS